MFNKTRRIKDHRTSTIEKWGPYEWFAIVAIFSGLAVLLLFLGIVAFTGRGPIWNYDGPETGAIGEFIGGIVGSLWSFAGVLLIYSTLKIQRRGMKQVRLQMKRDRRRNEKEDFERTFFNLCTHLRALKANLRVRGLRFDASVMSGMSQTSYEGAEVLKYLEEMLRQFVVENPNHPLDDQLTEFFDKTDFAAHYYRSVYHILKFIKLSAPADNIHPPKFYADILQAELSSSELFLICYNSWLPRFSKLKVLRIEFDFIQNLRYDCLISDDHRALRRKEEAHES
ncbi:MAG: putative phage abortive infection protein [Bacteroidota bacterium]|nr:putative phage abortive infection protein [Bacteroidota bacterium]MDP4232820.1 putative phage abortive infection protein [Bacteroidota bacterium]MDP4242499.1 putative phage abortive infection protein [Bacteroidota bacterium]MDP4289023.1 putative phage abortive infection protein [Bacteroidota bacterium]